MTTIELRRTPSLVGIATLSIARTDGPRAAGQGRLVAAAAAVPPITMLHLNATGAVEPAGWTISDYVVTLPYGIPLFAMTTGRWLSGPGCWPAGWPSWPAPGVLRGLLAVWAVPCWSLAVFPTNLRGTPENFSSNVHLCAGAVVFAVLPAAGVMLARWQRALSGRSAMTVALTAISVVSGVLSTALILNRLPGVIGMPELMLPPGILQRAAGAVEILLLAVAAAAVLRSAHRAR